MQLKEGNRNVVKAEQEVQANFNYNPLEFEAGSLATYIK